MRFHLRPTEPDYSCPHLDAAIVEIESARSIHDKLRRWGTYWENQASEIEESKTAEIEELEKKVRLLEADIDYLKDEIEQLRNKEI